MKNVTAKLIPLPDAAHLAGVDISLLIEYIHQQLIPLVISGEGVVSLTIDDATRAAKLHEIVNTPRAKYIKEHYPKLKGVSISLSDAAQKYQVDFSLVQRWSALGLIRRLGVDGRRVMVEESDVAYCVDTYRYRGAGQGIKLFDDNGQAYIPRTVAKRERA